MLWFAGHASWVCVYLVESFGYYIEGSQYSSIEMFVVDVLVVFLFSLLTKPNSHVLYSQANYHYSLGFQPAPPSPMSALSVEHPRRTESPKSTMSVHTPRVSPRVSPGLSPGLSPRLSAQSSSARNSVSSFYLPIPNTDQLPTSLAALEGLLNHYISQLQKLADRVEAVNEWIDLDKIVLARIAADDAAGLEKAAVEDGAASGPEGESVGKNQNLLSSPRTSTVPWKNNRYSSDGNGEAMICRVREATERIRGMKRWRKELERSVYWQREEYWRVEKAMGRRRSESVERGESVGRSEKEDVGNWVGAR